MKQDERESAKGTVQQQCRVSSSIFSNYTVPKLVLEALDGFLFTLDTQGNVKFVSDNIKNYLKYSPIELLDKNVSSMVHCDDVKYFDYFLAILASESRKKWLDSDVKSRTQSFNCRLLVKPGTEINPPQYNTMLMRVQPQTILTEDDTLLLGDENSPEQNKNYTLACIAEKIMFPAKLPKIPEVQKLITKQNLDGLILETSSRPENCTYGSMKWLEGKRIRDYCHVSDQSLVDKHFFEVLSRGDNMSGVYRLRIPAGDYLLIQSLSKLVYSSSNHQPEGIASTHQIYRKCTTSELDGRAWVHLMTRIFDDSSSMNISSGLSLSGGDLICQPAFSLSSAETESLLSSVNCVQSNEHCINGFEGSFDVPTVMDQQNLNDLADIMKLLEEQDGSSFAENGASQSDLNLSLEYLLNCKSTDVTVMTQPNGPSLPLSNVNVLSHAVNQLSSHSTVVNQQITTSSQFQSQPLFAHQQSTTSSHSQLQRLLSDTSQDIVDATVGDFNTEFMSSLANNSFITQLQEDSSRSVEMKRNKPVSSQGLILRTQLLQSHGDKSSPMLSLDYNLSSTCASNVFSAEVLNTLDRLWRIPQQPDQARLRHHSSQTSSLASALNKPRSPVVANCRVSPSSQHIGLKDLLLNVDSSSDYGEDLPRLHEPDSRRAVEKGSTCTPPYSTGYSPLLSSISLAAEQAPPTHPVESTGWQSRPPLILKSLLADPVSVEGTADENSEIGRILAGPSNIGQTGRAGIDQVPGLKSAASSVVASSYALSLSSPTLASRGYGSFRDSSIWLSTAEQFTSSESELAVAPEGMRSPFKSLSESVSSHQRSILSSMLSSGFVSMATAASSSVVSESSSAVMSRLLVAASSSSTGVLSPEGCTSSSVIGKKTTNHLLRQLLEKNSPTTQQQLLPKLIDDQFVVNDSFTSCSPAMAQSAISSSQKTDDQNPLPSKRPRLTSYCQDDELKARLTELCERKEKVDITPPSPSIIHAGTKRKSLGDVLLPARSVALSPASPAVTTQSQAESKPVNGFLSQMLMNNIAAATSMTTAFSICNVAMATPQMNMARNISNSLDRKSSMTDLKMATVPTISSTSMKQNDLLVSQLKRLSSGTDIGEVSTATGSKVTPSFLESYDSAPQNINSNFATDPTCPVSLDDDDDVMRFLNSDSSVHVAASANVESSDGETVSAFLQQLEQILSEATESDIESVLNDGVIPSTLAPSFSIEQQRIKDAQPPMYSSGLVLASSSVEHMGIDNIQSQLMCETSSIQPPAQHQQKLLGLLLSEGSSPSRVAKSPAAVERDLMVALQRGRPAQLSQAQNNFHFLNQSGAVGRSAIDAVNQSVSVSNNSEGVLAMVQRAAADAAARSGRHVAVASAANELMSRSLTPVSHQQNVGFSQNPEWINLNDLMNVSFAPNVSLERDASGLIVTSVHQKSTQSSHVRPSISTSTQLQHYLPTSTVVSMRHQVPRSPLLPTTAISRTSSTAGSPITSPGQVIPRSPLTYSGPLMPSSPVGQTLPGSPLKSVGAKVSNPFMTSGGQLITPGSSLRVVMAPAPVAPRPPSTVVQPVLAAVLRQPVSGVQLVWNQRPNPTFMARGVLVQGDLFNKLTTVRPTSSNSGEKSICVLGSSNGVVGSGGGSVAVRLISPQPTTVSSVVPAGIVRFLVTEPSRQQVQLVTGQRAPSSTHPVILSSILGQQESRKLETMVFPRILISSSATRSDSKSSISSPMAMQSVSITPSAVTQPPSDDNSSVFYDDVEGELPLDVLQSLSELADEHKMDQAAIPGKSQTHQQPLSAIDASTAADLRIPVIENWLHQPAAQAAVDVMQEHYLELLSETLRPVTNGLAESPSSLPQSDRRNVLSAHLNTAVRVGSSFQPGPMRQAGQTKTRLNVMLQSDQNPPQATTRQTPILPFQTSLPLSRAASGENQMASASGENAGNQQQLEMIRYQLTGSNTRVRSVGSLDEMRVLPDKGSVFNSPTSVRPVLPASAPRMVQRSSSDVLSQTSYTGITTLQNCPTLRQELAANVSRVSGVGFSSAVDTLWRLSPVSQQQQQQQSSTVTSTFNASNPAEKGRSSQSLLQQLLSD